MPQLSRRAVLSGATAVGAGVLTGAAGPEGGGTVDDLITVRPGDRRYPAMVVGNNQRFTAAPEAVHLVRTTEETVAAVAAAVRSGRRLSVRGGGHCYADLVYHPQAQVIVDLSLMNRIDYDPDRRAFMVEAGAQLGDVYETLYRGWGVILPGGVCPYVGIGGQAMGGGYGYLTRRFGMVSDHIEAAEVVVVDAQGGVGAVIASRSSTGALRELWWALCGGGGGSFGVVTRFWFRSPGAAGADPGAQLPQPPPEVLVSNGQLSWRELDQARLTALLRNYGRWHEEHAGPDLPHSAATAALLVTHPAGGGVGLSCLMDATLPGARRVMDDFHAQVTAGTGMLVPPPRRLEWPVAERLLVAMDPETLDMSKRMAVKSAYMRTAFTEEQCAALYRSFTREDYANPLARLMLFGAGGRPNTVPPDAIAYAHRNATYAAVYGGFWLDPAEDAAHLAWLRELYGGMFADTGGYPVPNEHTDGCYINSPDPDILDPALNRSGVPWHGLYFKDNYPRLQRAKERWDPCDVFRHSHSIRLPAPAGGDGTI